MQKTWLTPLFAPLFLMFSIAANAAALDPVKTATPSETKSIELVAGQIDINAADAALLQRELIGVGKAKSEAIIAYREQHGNFASVDELLEVDGIGKVLLDRNRDKLVVK